MCVLFPGKGKTPLRRNNNVAVSVVAPAHQTKAQVLESSCEKSCQVTSEQIKADMKAATENSKRTSSNGIAPEAGATNARPPADRGTFRGTGSAGVAARSGVQTVTGSVSRVGPGVATSRQGGGCGRVLAGTTHRGTTTTDRATGTGRTIDGTEAPSGVHAGDSCSRDAGVRQCTSAAGVYSLNPTDASVNHASRRPTLLTGQGQRQQVPAGSAAAGSGSQQGQARDKDFVPRRPLTRSCTRMSSASLVPETGKTEVTNRAHFKCIH